MAATPLEQEVLNKRTLESEIVRVRSQQTRQQEAIDREKSIGQLRQDPAVDRASGRTLSSLITAEQPVEDDGVIDNLVEVVGTAGERALEEMLETVGDVGDALENWTSLTSPRIALGNEEILDDRGIPVPFSKMRLAWFTGDEWKQYVERGEAGDLLDNVDLPDVDRPDSALGQATSDILRWFAGYALTRRLAPMRALGKGAPLAQGGIASAVVLDPVEENLVNILNEHFPSLTPDAILFLESDPEAEVELMNRFRTSLVDSGLGAMTDLLVSGLRYAKNIRAAKRFAKEAKDPATDRVVKDIADEDVVEVAPAADEAPPVEPEVIPEAPTPGTAARDHAAEINSAVERVRRSVQDSDLAAQLIDKINKGGIRNADEGIDFNFTTRDWESIAERTGEDPAVLRQVLNDVSEIFEPAIKEATGGVQRLDVTQALAHQMGDSVGNVQSLFADVKSGSGMAARYMAASQVLQSSAANVANLARQAAKDGAKDADVLAAHRAIELHGMLQAQIKGAQTEIARSLHAMRVVKAAGAGVDQELAEAVEKLAGSNKDLRRKFFKQLGKERSLRNLNRKIRKTRWERTRDQIIEFYINGLLSAPSTQVLNIVSNGIKMIEEPIARYMAAGIGRLRNAATHSPVERIALREANAAFFGSFQGIMTALRIPLKEILADVQKVGFKEAFERASKDPELGTVYRAAIQDQPITDVLQRVDIDTKKAIPGKIGEIVRLPGRGILTSDEFFKAIAYSQELHARAYREAARLADEKALTGARKEKFMALEVQRFISDPPEDLHMAAIDFGRYQTFQSPLESKAALWMEQGLTRIPILRFIMPFYRTPVNIVKQAILDRSPLGLIAKQTRNKILKGGPEGDLALARMVMGMSAMGISLGLYSSGRLTGNNRSAPAQANTKELSGIPSYSMKFGDKWVQYNRLDPYGMLLGLTADLMDGLHALSADPEDREALETGWEAVILVATAISENVTSKTWFKGLSDLFLAAHDSDRYLKSVATGLTTTLVTPYSSLLRRINVDHDPLAREAWDWMDKWRSNIPGLSDRLPLRRDFLGNPIEKQDYLGGAWLSPVAVGAEKGDPVYKELARLAFNYDMPDKDVYTIGKRVTPEQYSRFLELSGPAAKVPLRDALERLMSSEVYRNRLSDGAKIDEVKSLVSSYRQTAKAALLLEDSELRDAVVTAQRQQILDLIQ